MSIINKLNKGTTKQSLVPKIIQRWWIDCEWNYSLISNEKHEKKALQTVVLNQIKFD